MSQDVKVNDMSSANINDENRDEIDLVDLIKSIWSQRGLVVGFMLMAVLAVLSFHLSKASFSSANSVDYPISVSFLKENRFNYPSGVSFSPRDLITSDVLQNAIVKLDRDIDLADLEKAIGVKSSNSLLKQAESRLKTLLEDVKTPEDISAAAKSNLHNLQELGRGHITISLDLDKLDISAHQGSLLLEDVVQEWARLSIRRGLMNLDIDRPIVPFVIKENSNLIDDYDQAASYLGSLNVAVGQLSSLSGSGSLIVNNMSIADLERRLHSLGARDIGPLREFAYSNSDTLSHLNLAIQVRLYARQRLLNLDHDRLTQLIASFDIAAEQLGANIKQQYPGSATSNASQSSTAQFDKSFLDSLIQLGTKLSAVDTRKQLFERRMKAVDQLLDLEKEIAILKGASADKVLKIDPVVILSGALINIKDDLNEVQQNIGYFVDAVRELTLNSNSQVYIADNAPQVRGGYMQLAPRFALFVVLGGVLGLFLGIFVALIRSALLKSK
jgi:hypothetical protein